MTMRAILGLVGLNGWLLVVGACGGKTQTHRHREERGQEQGFPQRKRR